MHPCNVDAQEFPHLYSLCLILLTLSLMHLASHNQVSLFTPSCSKQMTALILVKCCNRTFVYWAVHFPAKMVFWVQKTQDLHVYLQGLY